jgi:hypothetical protein
MMYAAVHLMAKLASDDECGAHEKSFANETRSRVYNKVVTLRR